MYKGGMKMKRCSSCNFPNIDSDPLCFKCRTPLPEETSPEPTAPLADEDGQATSSQEVAATLDTTPTPSFDSNTNVIQFIRTPSEAPLPTADEEICAASDITLPQMPPPIPITTAPVLKTPSRILPRYKVFNVLSVIAKVTGILFGLLLIFLGVGSLLTFSNILGVISLILCISFGIISIILAFTFSALLGWLTDIECNQRKQIELINHLYHKISDQ